MSGYVELTGIVVFAGWRSDRIRIDPKAGRSYDEYYSNTDQFEILDGSYRSLPVSAE